MNRLGMKKLVYLLCVALLPLSAQAKSPPKSSPKSTQCYSTAELEAEMLVRLHSELMVVTLSCRTSSTGQPLPPIYQQFTQHHLEQIKGSEKALIAWYRKNGLKDPQSKFDRMRTELANAYSQQIADMSPVDFCAKYRDYAAVASGWNVKEMNAEVHNLVKTHVGHAPLCQEPQKTAER
jgi:hypothetical protein